MNFDHIARILFVFIHRNDEKLFGFELWFNVGVKLSKKLIMALCMHKEVFGMI